MDRQNEGSEDPPQGGWSCWTWEVSCHIGMGTHRGHLKRIVMTFYLVHPLLLYICPVWGKDHSITLVSFNNRYQKVLNLLKKVLDYMERGGKSLQLKQALLWNGLDQNQTLWHNPNFNRVIRIGDEFVQDTVTDTFYIFMAAATINTSICWFWAGSGLISRHYLNDSQHKNISERSSGEIFLCHVLWTNGNAWSWFLYF